MAETYIPRRSNMPARLNNSEVTPLKKSETTAATEETAGRALRGMIDAGDVSEADGNATAVQLGKAITVADQAEQTVKKTATPESQAEARKMATTREAGLAAALHSRLPADQLQATNLSKTEAAGLGMEAVTAMDPVVTQMENLAAAKAKVGEEIAGLEKKQPRTAGEDALLTAKQHQAEALDATSTVLRDRVDILRATKDAALNEEEDGGLAINQDEAESLATATRATDVAALAASNKGRMADAEVAMALDAVKKEGAATANLPANASNVEANAHATGVNAPAGGQTLPAGESYSVKPGDWLTKIAANHKNADGSRVTLEQLLDTPGNEKFKKNPNLIHPGDVVKLPAGAVRADGTAANEVKKPVAAEASPAETNASVDAKKTVANKPKLGLSTSTATKPMDAAQINETVSRTNAQMKTVNDARQGLLDDGVGGLDTRVDPKRINKEADAVIGRHQTRLADVNRVGAELDNEIKTLSARTNRTPAESALLEAKRTQRSEATALAGALEGSIAGLNTLKGEASDGRITDAEAKAILSRYQTKQKGITDSAAAGMKAGEQLSQAFEALRNPEAKAAETPDTVWV